jgi:hypothetical protein
MAIWLRGTLALDRGWFVGEMPFRVIYAIWFMCVDNDSYRCQYGST